MADATVFKQALRVEVKKATELEQWLHQRQVKADDLQAAVDQFLEQARQTASDAPAS